jgi:predicted porin
MNKKLMAVAVAAAVAAPGLALAQVTIYGKFNVEYGFLDQASGPGGVQRDKADAFNNGASRIGFRAEEKLGGGISSWFQCETRARILEDAATTLCDRNSALGMKGGFGNVFFGRWDTPINLAQDGGRITPTTGWAGTERLLLDDQGQQGWTFARRETQTINYMSPNMGGFTIHAQTTSTNATVGTNPSATGNKGRTNGINAQYSGGPLTASAAYAKMEDNRSTQTGAAFAGEEQTAILLGASFTFGPIKLGALWTSIESDATATTTVERDSWEIAALWSIGGPAKLRFSYVSAGDFKGNDPSAAPANQGTSMYSVSYLHSFSKRTTGTIGYSVVDNDTNGVYNFAGGTSNILPGDKSSVIFLQLEHSF